MVRACCVSTCHSGKNVPSHLFPKNTERRKLWLESLRMKPLEESKMQKLRVCHKHFRDSDYSCSPTRRVIKSTAIPSIHMPSVEKDTTQANTGTVASNLSQHTSQNNEGIEDICKERYKQLESQLQEQRQLILQRKTDYNVFVEQRQLKEQQQELILKQYEEELQQQRQLLNQQEQEIQQLKETISMYLQQSSKTCAKPDPGEMSRKKLLTPRAKKFYERTVQLKKRQ